MNAINGKFAIEQDVGGSLTKGESAILT